MKIVFGLIFFQDKQSIDRLLPTLPKYHVIGVDGRNKGFPSNNKLSTDGSRLSLENHGATIIDLPDVTEFEKRESYLRAAQEMNADVLIVIDSDHQLVGDWRRFEDEIKKLKSIPSLYSMPVYTQGVDNVYRFAYMPLVIVRPEQLHYEERHDKICLNHIQQSPSGIINGVLQINNHDLRTQDRIAKGYIYKVLNRKVETGKLPATVLDEMRSIGW